MGETDNKDKLFYYFSNVNGLWGKAKEETKRYLIFQKIHNKNVYLIKIIANHPSLTDYSFLEGTGDDKTKRFYLIDNISLDSFEKIKSPKDNFFRKEIDLADQITITPFNP